MTLLFSQDETTGNVILEDDLVLPMPGGIEMFTVPKGTVSDGRSSGRLLWLIVGPPIRNKYMRSWLGHDVLCDRATTLWDRSVADALLGYWLIKQGAPLHVAGIHFWAVFVYGRLCYPGKKFSGLFQRRKNQ